MKRKPKPKHKWEDTQVYRPVAFPVLYYCRACRTGTFNKSQKHKQR